MISSTVAAGDNLLATQYNNLRKDRMHLGSIIMFTADPFDIPADWLLCQGQSLDTTTYAALFGVIGYTFGGSGSSFNLPNMQDRHPVGQGSSYSMGGTGGGSATLVEANIKSHTHTISTQAAHSHTLSQSGATTPTINRLPANTYAQLDTGSLEMSVLEVHAHTLVTVGSATPISLEAPYYALNFIICNSNQSSDVAALDDVLDTQYNQLRRARVPSGGVVMHGHAAPPTGYLLCNGQSVSTTTYEDLFDLFGYTYGGAGASFSMPDLRDRFVIGKSGTKALGVTGGGTATIVSANLPAHTHTMPNSPTHSHTFPRTNSSYPAGSTLCCFHGNFTSGFQVTVGSAPVGTHTHGGTTGSIGTGSAFNVLPSYIGLTFCIKY
jgi:microcystin-dependent protein